MYFRFKIITLFVILTLQGISAQELSLSLVPINVNCSFRGLSVIDDNTAWVAGTKGTIGITANGGNTWSFTVVSGFEKMDFRSIYAFDSKVAVIANAGSPSYILRTDDGGKSWSTVYENTDPKCFFDGIDFWDSENGIIYGDPLDGRIFILTTSDGGRSWKELPAESRPAVSQGEASFAASGTGIRCYDRSKVVMVTGGSVSRFHVSNDAGATWRSDILPVIQGTETTGAFSVALNGSGDAIICGGDYVNEQKKIDHIFYSDDEGITWKAPERPTGGFRECVIFVNGKSAIALGPGGIDYSADKGMTWESLSSETGFHVIAKARRGNLIIASGNMKIAVIGNKD